MTHFLLFLLGLGHAFYVSLAELQYNAEQESLEVSMRFFTDDLEKAISMESPKGFRVLKPGDSQRQESERLIGLYVAKYFSVTLDGRPLTLRFLGYEQEDDSTWCYFEVDGLAAAPTKVEVRNACLMNAHPEQTNIVNVRVGKEKKGLILKKHQQTGVLRF